MQHDVQRCDGDTSTQALADETRGVASLSGQDRRLAFKSQSYIHMNEHVGKCLLRLTRRCSLFYSLIKFILSPDDD